MFERFLSSNETIRSRSNQTVLMNDDSQNSTNPTSFSNENSFQNIQHQIINSLPIWAWIFIGVYFIFSIFLSCFMYNRLKKFWSPKDLDESSCFKSKRKTNDEILLNNEELKNRESYDTQKNSQLKGSSEEIINKTYEDFHDKYPEYKRFDASYLSYLRCLICALLFWWPRIATMLVCLVMLIISFAITSCCYLPKNPLRKIGKFKYYINYILLQIWISPLFWVLGYITCYKKKKDEKIKQIYKKYLGENYDLNHDKPFGCYISNHLGWFECFYYGWKHCCGFIAKAEIAKILIMDLIMSSLNCLLVARDSKDSREEIASNLKERQRQYHAGETAAPLLIFPEGTTTNGKYILKFKHGAFLSLLPVKPIFIYNDVHDFGIGDSPMTTFDHFYYTFGFIYRLVYFYELPVIECTDYLLQNHSLENEDKAETYTRVVNMIYQEAFDIPYSDKGFRDLREYENLCKNQ